MVRIQVNNNTVVFEAEGWDKLWAFKGKLEIPATHIRNVYSDPNCAIKWFDSIKLIGTSIPTIFRAGTFYQNGDFVFWDVHNVQNTIVIELEHEHFAKLIVEVEEPATAISLLNNAIRSSRT